MSSSRWVGLETACQYIQAPCFCPKVIRIPTYFKDSGDHHRRNCLSRIESPSLRRLMMQPACRFTCPDLPSHPMSFKQHHGLLLPVQVTEIRSLGSIQEMNSGITEKVLCIRQPLGYTRIFVWDMICPRVKLAARLLAAESTWSNQGVRRIEQHFISRSRKFST